MSFEEQLRRARERAGLTQQEVADAMQLDKSTYCGYETGKRKPDVAKIKKLSAILNSSGDELLETGYTSNDSSSEISKQYMRLDAIDRAKAEAYIAGLLAAEKYQGLN